jgi:alpha-tubulin suppressor-like RCC1 family protein
MDGRIKEGRAAPPGARWRVGWEEPAMRVLRCARPLARPASAAVLAFGVAAGAAAGSPPAQAQVLSPVVTGHAAVSWGNNFHGQLGNGTTASRLLFGPVSGLGDSVVQVAAGEFHSLALTSDGTVWAWGANGFGQLGNGTTTDSSVPVQVAGLTGVVAVSASDLHSLALRSNGTVWAWGNNDAGQLGNGTTTDSWVPVQVKGLAGVTKIAAGSGYSLALRSDGTVWAWGSNHYGQLGNGTTKDSWVPVRVTGLSQVTSIAAGAGASYAISTRSITTLTTLWAWGSNGSGELGDGTVAGRTTPGQVTGISSATLAGISAGIGYAIALGSDGSAWGWGDDSNGQLGNAPATSPVLRPVETIGPGSGITQLSAGVGFTLGLRSDGTALAWGDNSQGQLGDGTTASHVGPEQVAGLTGATQVSAGFGFSLAVTALATVPNVVGDTTSAASSILRAAGFVLGPVSFASDYTCNYLGVIKSQNPAAGGSVRLGSPVAVTVGTQPPTPCP